MRGLPGRALPSLGDCIDMNLQVAQLTSPDVVMTGIALNTSAFNEATAHQLCYETSNAHGLPCTDPHRFGVEALLDALPVSGP